MTFFEPSVNPDKLGNQPRSVVTSRKLLSEKCKAKKPTPEIMTITPEFASIMLERNLETNRSKSKRTSDRYTAEMGRDRMIVTNQGIGFNTNGYLIDGQHRLMACMASGHAFDSLVVFGLEPDAFMFVDSGSKRTAGHKLHIAGFGNSNKLAAAAKIVLIYDLAEIALRTTTNFLGVFAKDNSIIPDEFIVDFCEENPAFVELHKWYPTYSRFKPLAHTTFQALHWIIAQKHPKLANAFIEQLSLGESLNRSDNVYRLREHLMNLYISRDRVSKAWQMAWVIDAFNDTRRGKTTRFEMIAGRDFPKVLS